MWAGRCRWTGMCVTGVNNGLERGLRREPDEYIQCSGCAIRSLAARSLLPFTQLAPSLPAHSGPFFVALLLSPFSSPAMAPDGCIPAARRADPRGLVSFRSQNFLIAGRDTTGVLLSWTYVPRPQGETPLLPIPDCAAVANRPPRCLLACALSRQLPHDRRPPRGRGQAARGD